MSDALTRGNAQDDETVAFNDFAARLAVGDADAAEALLERYAARLHRLAQSRLGKWLAGKSAPEDVLQSVLRTFYRRIGEGQVTLRDWESLSGFLAVLTIRKCQRDARRYGTERRDARREISLNAFASDAETQELCLEGKEPSPVEGAMLSELIEQLLASFGDRERAILERLFEGRPIASIAAELGCSERTAYRTLERVRTRLVEPARLPQSSERLSKSRSASPFP
jgi:RNA polymerase sigma factor (sigma-70 family)